MDRDRATAMTYPQAMERLKYAAMFPKSPGLSNMHALLKALGSPEQGLRIVHIAGTNGKGSTAAFLCAALRRAGYRTGLFCSPYVEHFCERVQVDGIPIEEAAVGRILARVAAAAKTLPREATFFELVTALGLCYFQERGCDIVALEVGMGGALDPTNVIPCPAVAVISHIGLDHTAVLGDTIEQIALQKSGIIKHGGDVLLLAQDAAVEQVVQDAALAANATLTLASPPPYVMEGARAVLTLEGARVPLGLCGRFQAENAGLAYATLQRLREKGMQLPLGAIIEGFGAVSWPGRFTLLLDDPPFVLDGAHNPLGMHALCDSLIATWPDRMRERRAVFLVGMMQDKDYMACLRILAPHARAMIAIAADEPRCLPAPMLAQAMQSLCAQVYAFDTPAQGIEHAISLVGHDGLIAACGSLHLCAHVRACVERTHCPA